MQGFAPCEDDKPKNAEISPFGAGSDYSLLPNQERSEAGTTVTSNGQAAKTDRTYLEAPTVSASV